jgi:hypothetical protein
MCPFKSGHHLQRFASVHDQDTNLSVHCRYYPTPMLQRLAA